MAHESFAKTVFDMILELAAKGNGEASCGDLSSALHIQTRLEHKRLLNTCCDLYRTGKLRRVRQGVYAPAGTPVQPDKREVMWRLLKMRRRITVDDLVELAAVSRQYAREWLQILVKREVVRKIQEPGKAGLWVLINDSAEMPLDDSKAERLRTIRKQKKQQITVRLDAIGTALGEIRTILNDMDKE